MKNAAPARAAFVVFRIGNSGLATMEIGQNLPERDAPRRDRLPNRRGALSTSFERDGAHFQMTAGFYPDGRAGEVFVNADRANSLLDFLMSDAAILVSLALQYGAPLDEIRHALKRDVRGTAASPIGAALDLIP
jgi:hypothetical protein